MEHQFANARRQDDSRGRTALKAKAAANAEPSVRITQQFREIRNMTYELDCSGVKLVLRVFFPVEGARLGQWEIEACSGLGERRTATRASASSRAQALQNVAQSWREQNSPTASNLDWNGIAQAMASVRAI
jgi:hypothetical protein